MTRTLHIAVLHALFAVPATGSAVKYHLERTLAFEPGPVAERAA